MVQIERKTVWTLTWIVKLILIELVLLKSVKVEAYQSKLGLLSQTLYLNRILKQYNYL